MSPPRTVATVGIRMKGKTCPNPLLIALPFVIMRLTSVAISV